ncbi:MAG: HAMP domain-containing histidine kinase [Verrucomicrobiota bacterium]|nr:HAMP domain-containing histidine kinase [Verrucomicrobiota bacterium]
MKERIVGLEAGKLAPLPLDGPAEFRGIAVVFNELIAQLQLQRESQLRFLAGIAHDLRTPLQAIKLSAELLGDHLSAEQRATVRTIDRQISQLDRQVGDLLDTTRIESGQLELRISEQDLAQLVETSAKVFRGLSARHRIQVTAPDKPIIYPCDPTRIGQVLNNLLSNAIKYSPSGGEITAALSASASGVEFAVTDQGIGISAEDLPHVFEPFRRTAATREAIPGVGLGLSVARRIAEAHGGSIEVKSVPAAGSSFTLSLPKTPPR